MAASEAPGLFKEGAEMRLIDADALMIATLNFCNGYKVKWTDRKVISWINHAPTIDAVPVVRCKDCKYWDTKGICDLHTEVNAVWMDANDFCSKGERRSDA